MSESRAVVHLIAAARPNFMKVAPLFHALRASDWCRPVLVHTGQHYDREMSDAFLDDLRLPRPDMSLEAGSGSHAEQTARVMVAYEQACGEQRPDWTVVVGDVNSTLACALAAKKLQLKVAHLEAGLRSGDRSMPEEINRVMTDAIADLLWTPSADGDENLLREGVPPERIQLVGNIMIDSYELLRERIEAARPAETAAIASEPYGVVTLHRPTNVDDPTALRDAVSALGDVAKRLPLLFPVHPRTLTRLKEFGLWSDLVAAERMVVVPPMGYVDFMAAVTRATVVISDSGGVQEETTYLGIPCLTVRTSTERPVTVTHGTNRLVSMRELVGAVDRALDGDEPTPSPPPLWDGRTASRVAASLHEAQVNHLPPR